MTEGCCIHCFPCHTLYSSSFSLSHSATDRCSDFTVTSEHLQRETLLSTPLHACCHSAVSAPAPGFLPPCRSCMCPESLWQAPTELSCWRTGLWRTGRTRPCELRSNQENPFASELADCRCLSQDNTWVPKCQNGTAWKISGQWKGPEVRALENLNCCWKCHFPKSVSKPRLELFCYSVLTEKVQASCLSCQQAFILNSASACTCSWQPQGLHSDPACQQPDPASV